MLVTYITHTRNAMKTSRRTFLAHIMNDAWTLARQGAQKFGGSVKLYFGIALRLVWWGSRPRTLWHKGIGNQFVLPGLSDIRQAASKGQFLLPGMSDK